MLGNVKLPWLYGYFKVKKKTVLNKNYKLLYMLPCSVDCQSSSQTKGGLPVASITEGTQRRISEQHAGTA